MATEVKDPSQTDVTKAVNAVGADLKDPFSSTSYRKKAEDATTAGQKATTELGDIYTKRDVETQPFIEKGEKALKAQEDLQPPKLQDLPKYERKPIDAEEAKNTYSTLMAFAFIGGALSRQPMQAALANMTAIMKGTMEGDANRVKKETDEFEKNYKSAKQQRDSQLEEYKLAIDKNKGNLQGIMDSVKLVGLKYGDQVSAKLAEQGNFKEVSKHYETLARQAQTAEQTQKQFLLNIRKQNELERRAQERHEDMVKRMDKPTYMSGIDPISGKQAIFELAPGKAAKIVEGTVGSDLTKVGGGAGGGIKIGSRERTAVNNLVASSNEGAQVISDLAYLSAGDPLFANKLADVDDKGSIMGGVGQYMSRKMSTEKQQEYVKLIDSMVGVLTRVQSGTGYASDVTKGKMDQLRKVILAKEGATNSVGYQSIAEMNQIFVRGLEALSTNIALNPEQKALINKNIKEAADAIPYTVKDVFDYSKANYKGTMQEYLDSEGRSGRQLERIRQETPDPNYVKVVKDDTDYNNLKSGETFVDPNGVKRTKP